MKSELLQPSAAQVLKHHTGPHLRCGQDSFYHPGALCYGVCLPIAGAPGGISFGPLPADPDKSPLKMAVFWMTRGCATALPTPKPAAMGGGGVESTQPHSTHPRGVRVSLKRSLDVASTPREGYSLGHWSYSEQICRKQICRVAVGKEKENKLGRAGRNTPPPKYISQRGRNPTVATTMGKTFGQTIPGRHLPSRQSAFSSRGRWPPPAGGGPSGPRSAARRAGPAFCRRQWRWCKKRPYSPPGNCHLTGGWPYRGP